MTGYRVDLDELRRLIEQAALLEKRVTDRLAEIDRRVEDLHVHWDGHAAVTHKAAHDVWMRAAADMQTALGKLRAGTQRAHNNYSGNTTVNKGMWPE